MTTSCNTTDGELQLVISPAGTYDVLIDANPFNGQVSDGTTAIVFGGYGSATISSVTVTESANGCNVIDNTGWTLTAPGAPTADAGPDVAICDNGSHVLTAVNPSATATTVEWTGGLADGSTVNPTTTTTYTLSITENGCTATDDMIVSKCYSSSKFKPSDAEYCDGDPITALSASTTGGTITWYDLNSNAQGTGTTLTPAVGVGGSSCYQVQADNNGCISPIVGPVCVTVNANPTAPVISGNILSVQAMRLT